MQIVLFHLMPYADLDLEAGRKNGTVWVKLPNRHFLIVRRMAKRN